MTVVRSLLSATFIATLAATPAAAQSASPRADLAVQFTSLRLSDVDAVSTGIGGRVTVGLVPWVSLDGEFTFVPSDDVTLMTTVGGGQTAGLTYERRRSDGFLGVKVGRRFERFGLFAKARPGFSRLVDEGVGCSGDVCALLLIAAPDYETQFVFDLGGIVEFYPSERFLARVDLGSTFIRHRSLAPPCTGCTSRNLTANVGVGVRF